MNLPENDASSLTAAGAGARVLVVDDERLFLDTISMTLEDEGFQVTAFDNGQSALDFLAAGNTADVLLLDWQMPGLDGMEVLRRVRDIDLNLPVIFLTALSNQIYEEAALARGAVDFVDKTRSFAIILRRIRLITDGGKPVPGKAQAAVPEEAPRGDVGPLVLRADISRAFWNGEMVNLTLTEFNVVRLLAERAGEDVTYREIYDLVHGRGFVAGSGEAGYRANVRALVKRIRQKFRDIDPDFDQLDNYPGFGYRWVPTGAGKAP